MWLLVAAQKYCWMPRVVSSVTGRAASSLSAGATHTFITPLTGARKAICFPSLLRTGPVFSGLPKSSCRGISGTSASVVGAAVALPPAAGCAARQPTAWSTVSDTAGTRITSGQEMRRIFFMRPPEADSLPGAKGNESSNKHLVRIVMSVGRGNSVQRVFETAVQPGFRRRGVTLRLDRFANHMRAVAAEARDLLLEPLNGSPHQVGMTGVPDLVVARQWRDFQSRPGFFRNAAGSRPPRAQLFLRDNRTRERASPGMNVADPLRRHG